MTTLLITEEHEKVILSLAAKIRGARGGKAKSSAKQKAAKRNWKRAVSAQAA